MKGQTESYSFLIGIIITLLILVPIGIWFWNFTVASSETKECFDSLGKAIPLMKDAERGNVICNLDSKYAIVAFPPGSTAEEGISYITDVKFEFKAYPQDCKTNGCLCLCTFKRQWPEVCGDDASEKCIKIDWAKSIKGSIAVSDNTFAGSISDNKVFDEKNRDYFMANIEQQALPIYYERSGNKLGICFSSQCITGTEIMEAEICKKECNSIERNKDKSSCELVSCKKNCKWTTENKCIDMCKENCDSVIRQKEKTLCESGECDFRCIWNNQKCEEEKLYLDLTGRKLPN